MSPWQPTPLHPLITSSSSPQPLSALVNPLPPLHLCLYSFVIHCLRPLTCDALAWARLKSTYMSCRRGEQGWGFGQGRGGNGVVCWLGGLYMAGRTLAPASKLPQQIPETSVSDHTLNPSPHLQVGGRSGGHLVCRQRARVVQHGPVGLGGQHVGGGLATDRWVGSSSKPYNPDARIEFEPARAKQGCMHLVITPCDHHRPRWAAKPG